MHHCDRRSTDEFDYKVAIADRIVSQMGGTLDLMSPVSGQNSGFEARITLPA